MKAASKYVDVPVSENTVNILVFCVSSCLCVWCRSHSLLCTIEFMSVWIQWQLYSLPRKICRRAHFPSLFFCIDRAEHPQSIPETCALMNNRWYLSICFHRSANNWPEFACENYRWPFFHKCPFIWLCSKRPNAWLSPSLRREILRASF